MGFGSCSRVCTRNKTQEEAGNGKAQWNLKFYASIDLSQFICQPPSMASAMMIGVVDPWQNASYLHSYTVGENHSVGFFSCWFW